MQKPSDKIQDDFTGYILYTTFCQDILFYMLLMQTLSISILGSFKIMTWSVEAIPTSHFFGVYGNR